MKWFHLLRLKELLISKRKPSFSTETIVGEDALGAASPANLCDGPGELVGNFTGADTGAGFAVEDNALTLREVASHSDSAARNFPEDSMRRNITKVETSFKLNSKPSSSAKGDTTVTLVANHILAINAAARVATLMKQ